MIAPKPMLTVWAKVTKPGLKLGISYQKTQAGIAWVFVTLFVFVD